MDISMDIHGYIHGYPYPRQACRLQHCLEWATRVYTSKLTADSVVTYLFHDCGRSLWLFCLYIVWRVRTLVCDDQSTVHNQLCAPLACCRVLCMCTVWGINRVLLLTSICFFCAILLDFMPRIERLHFCYYCVDVWRVLAPFCREYSRAAPARRRRGYRRWRMGRFKCSRVRGRQTSRLLLLVSKLITERGYQHRSCSYTSAIISPSSSRSAAASVMTSIHSQPISTQPHVIYIHDKRERQDGLLVKSLQVMSSARREGNGRPSGCMQDSVQDTLIKHGDTYKISV